VAGDTRTASIAMNDARLLNLLGAAAIGLGDRLTAAVEETTGLAGGAPAAILCVGARPGRPIEALRQALGLSHSGTVRLVDRLEDRGWVERDAAAPGRAVLLELTAAGRELHDEILAARRRALAAALEPVPESQRQALGDALETLLHGLPDDRESSWRICRLCEHGVCRDDACPVGSAVDDAT